MSEASLASLSREPGFVAGVMTRRLAAAPDAVWRLMTEPAGLSQWLAPGRIEPRLGGAVRLDFADSGTVIDSAVTAFEAGRLVEFSWSRPGEPARPVRFEIAPDADGTALTLSVRTPDGGDPARACAGWEAHLAMLEAALAGAPIPFPFEVFKAAREAYRPVVAALG
jgi:uncharacterized protein YndB with AHSA1/START domain